jgi:hypothetical protein
LPPSSDALNWKEIEKHMKCGGHFQTLEVRNDMEHLNMKHKCSSWQNSIFGLSLSFRIQYKNCDHSLLN